MDLNILKMMPTPKKRKTIKQHPIILSNQRNGRRDRQGFKINQKHMLQNDKYIYSTDNQLFSLGTSKHGNFFYIEARYFEHVMPNFLLHV